MAVLEVRPLVAKAPTDSHRRVVVPLRRRAAVVPLCLLVAATLRVLASSLPTLDDSLLPPCLQDTRDRCTSHPVVRSLQLLERLLRPQSPLARVMTSHLGLPRPSIRDLPFRLQGLHRYRRRLLLAIPRRSLAERKMLGVLIR
jgi:hypothetical protein